MSQAWEFRVETLGSIWRGPSPQELEYLLNEAAGDGWDLVTMFNPSSGGNRLIAILRRESRTASRKRRDSWP